MFPKQDLLPTKYSCKIKYRRITFNGKYLKHLKEIGKMENHLSRTLASILRFPLKTVFSFLARVCLENSWIPHFHFEAHYESIVPMFSLPGWQFFHLSLCNYPHPTFVALPWGPSQTYLHMYPKAVSKFFLTISQSKLERETYFFRGKIMANSKLKQNIWVHTHTPTFS